MRFYIPPNLQSSFLDLIKSPVATPLPLNFNPNVIIRAIVPEIDHREKSSTVTKGTKYTYASTNIPLEIGDYLQDDNGIYLINQLRIERFPECFKFLLIECNAKFTVTRYEEATWDENGNPLTDAGDNPIATDFYCSIMVGGTQFTVTSGEVGIVPSNQTISQTRYTDETDNMKIGDNFMWFDCKYEIIDFDYSQISIEGKSGLLGFTGKKVIK